MCRSWQLWRVATPMVVILALTSECTPLSPIKAYQDRLDLSPASIIQTVQNVIRMPEALGGRRNADSDVRFGRSSAPEDPLPDIAQKFPNIYTRGVRFRINDRVAVGFDGPSSRRPFEHDFVQSRSIFAKRGGRRVPIHPIGSSQAIGLIPRGGLWKNENQRQTHFMATDNETRRFRNADDGAGKHIDFVGLAGQMFKPIPN